MSHHNKVWLSEKYHLFSWVLSFEVARRHYLETVLVTDDRGADLLVGKLGLLFSCVSTELNDLRSEDPEWWVLGKLRTYRMQSTPFVHLDSDVFLWKRLPEVLERAPIIAQNPERFAWVGTTWYRPRYLDAAVRAVDGWLPQEWSWYVAHEGAEAFCCGILGGRDTDFLCHYAETAIAMIGNPRNAQAWANLENKVGDNILVEQYLLAACVAYHRTHSGSDHAGVHVECLFPSDEEAFTEERAIRVGYTHLIGGAKRNRALARRLEERVRLNYPDLYERCLKVAIWMDRV